MPVFTQQDYLHGADFGFSFVSEHELSKTQEVYNDNRVNDQVKTIESLQKRLDLMYDAISPLLKNLSDNPGKKYILWEDRIAKVEMFRRKIEEIYQGKV